MAKVENDRLVPPVHSAETIPCPFGGVDVVAYTEDDLIWTIAHGVTVREAVRKAAEQLQRKTV